MKLSREEQGHLEHVLCVLAHSHPASDTSLEDSIGARTYWMREPVPLQITLLEDAEGAYLVVYSGARHFEDHGTKVYAKVFDEDEDEPLRPPRTMLLGKELRELLYREHLVACTSCRDSEQEWRLRGLCFAKSDQGTLELTYTLSKQPAETLPEATSRLLFGEQSL